MQYFLASLFLCSIRMSIITLIYFFATPFLMKRYAAKWCYYTWLIIVLGYVLPFSSHFKLTFVKLESSILTHLQENVLGKLEVTAASAFINGRAYQTLGTLWLLGAGLLLAYHGIRHYRFLRKVNRWAEEVNDLQTLNILKQMQSKVRVSRQIELKVCPLITSPMLIGVVKPAILLPSKAFSTYDLSFILKHELLHYKRRDVWFKSLVLLATAIHWFNPIVYIMAKAIAAQCEISCDAEVVKDEQIRERQQYSEAIIGVIKNQSRLHTVFSSYFYGGTKDLKKRIFSIMDTGGKKAGILVLCLVVLGTMTVNTIFAKDIATPVMNVHGVRMKSKMISEETIIDSNTGIKRKTEEKEYIGDKYL